MDEKDHEIIRMLKNGLPLDPEPFKSIGDMLWIDEMSVISRLASMKQSGVIRRLGAFFDHGKLGKIGVLAGMDVSPEMVDTLSAHIEKIPEISHNYLRDGSPNLWFTLVTESKELQEKILSDIREISKNSRMLLFPTKKVFKVRINLD
ncbi:MAG: Lrp/AsnC family transcriptional regulator [Candidatus Riflebacteria bacterium]|nr:Lrp/AsnC family transcriptional regulator [Candidatus Riflebacteria bacterium]